MLRLFRSGGKPLSVGAMLRALKLKRSNQGALVQVLDALVAQGKLVRSRDAFKLVEHLETITGRLQMQRSGVGFVLPDDTRKKDVFISEKHLGDAWHGDRVSAAVVNERRGKNPEGRIVRILERGRQSLSVVVMKKIGDELYLCRPTEPRMYFAVRATAAGKTLTVGTLALVAPGDKVDHNLWEGKVTAVLGKEQDVAAQEAVTKSNHSVPSDFPEDVLAQAADLPEAPRPDDLT
ncbi:MAG: ribonuclease R, partial [Proteobacteria bacterium]|nr:ribonuclease R [Pseudomonadota bacterium]